MASGLSKKFTGLVGEEIRFIKGLLDGPKAVGAIAPTSSVTARRMAGVIDPDGGGPVLELGPGTGVITRAILRRGVAPSRLTSIEYSRDFYLRLVKDFPVVNFIHGDAFDLERTLDGHQTGPFDAVVSAVPLLTLPIVKRIDYLESLLDLTQPGGPVVQISYGPVSPIPPERGSYEVQALDWIIRNLPPARIWIYRRSAANVQAA